MACPMTDPSSTPCAANSVMLPPALAIMAHHDIGVFPTRRGVASLLHGQAGSGQAPVVSYLSSTDHTTAWAGGATSGPATSCSSSTKAWSFDGLNRRQLCGLGLCDFQIPRTVEAASPTALPMARSVQCVASCAGHTPCRMQSRVDAVHNDRVVGRADGLRPVHWGLRCAKTQLLVRPTWFVRSAGIDHPGDVISAAPGDGKRELSLTTKNCYAPGKCTGCRHALTTIAGPPWHDLRRRRSSNVRQQALSGMAFASGPDRAIRGKGLESPMRHRHTLFPHRRVRHGVNWRPHAPAGRTVIVRLPDIVGATEIPSRDVMISPRPI